MNEMDKLTEGWNKEVEIPGVVQERVMDTLQNIKNQIDKPTQEEKQKGCGRNRNVGKKRWMKCAVVMAATLAVGTGVFAAGQFRLIDLFPKKMASPEAQELIDTELEVIVTGQEHMPNAYVEENTEDIFRGRPIISDNSSLLNIKEVQYDGSSLYIYGEPTENGKQYELNSDRLYINDQEYGPVSTSNLKDVTGENGYTFEVDLSALHLEEDFEVTLPLSVYEGETRYQNQELTFMVSAEAPVQNVEDQIFEQDGYSISVENIEITTNVVKFAVRYTISPEKKKELDEQGKGLASLVKISGDETGHAFSRKDLDDGYKEEYELAGISPEETQICLQTILCEKGGYVSAGEVVAENMIQIR